LFPSRTEVYYEVSLCSREDNATAKTGGDVLISIATAVVDGFGSGDIDFAARLGASAQSVQDGVNIEIVENIVSILRAGNAGGSLSVAGHADRDDTPGRSHIDCLASEVSASEARVQSAINHIQFLVQQREPSAPADLNVLPFFDVHLRASGAAVLEVNGGADMSEELRRRNRRVQLRLLMFTL
jgi:hypothetical protein